MRNGGDIAPGRAAGKGAARSAGAALLAFAPAAAVAALLWYMASLRAGVPRRLDPPRRDSAAFVRMDESAVSAKLRAALPAWRLGAPSGGRMPDLAFTPLGNDGLAPFPAPRRRAPRRAKPVAADESPRAVFRFPQSPPSMAAAPAAALPGDGPEGSGISLSPALAAAGFKFDAPAPEEWEPAAGEAAFEVATGPDGAAATVLELPQDGQPPAPAWRLAVMRGRAERAARGTVRVRWRREGGETK